MRSKSVSEWTVEDVIGWLKDSGHRDHYTTQCFERHQIDGKALMSLKEEDLKTMEIVTIGEIKRLNISIRQLQRENVPLLLELGNFDMFSPQNIFAQNKNDVRCVNIDKSKNFCKIVNLK